MSAPRDSPPKNGTIISHHEAVTETFTPQPPITENNPLSTTTTANAENESIQFAFGSIDPQPRTDQDQLEAQLQSNSNYLVNVGQPYFPMLDEIHQNQLQISTPENSQRSNCEPNESPIVSVNNYKA